MRITDEMRLNRPWQLAAGAAFAALIQASPVAAQATNCSAAFDSLTFGVTVDVTGTLPVTTQGAVTVTCTGVAGAQIRACLHVGSGSGGGLSPRTMLNGASTLSYNLFRDAARTAVWGSRFAGGTAQAIDLTLGAGGSGTGSAVLYASLPLPQITAPIGSYASLFSGDLVLEYGPLATTTCAAAATVGSAGTFSVSATVTPSCTVGDSALAFGVLSSLSTTTMRSASIAAVCTAGAPYQIGLGPGLGGAGGPTTRRMNGGSGGSLTYGLYKDAGCTLPWGWTLNGDTVSATGTGTSQNATVYGCIPPQPNPGPGAYSDTVAITLTY